MPIYEYRCVECGTLSSLLILRRDQAESVRCVHCRSASLERLMSRFASPKSDEARRQAMEDPNYLEGVDESDPESMTRLMDKMGADLGDEISETTEAELPPGDGTEDEAGLSDMA